MMKKDLIIALGFFLIGNTAIAQLVTYHVSPHETDSLINTFTNTNQKHIVFFNSFADTLKNQLFVFLPGLGDLPQDYQGIDSLAAKCGYHAIVLMYPNQPFISNICSESSDLHCYYKTRMEVIDGIDRTSAIDVNRANSIENRLIKLLHYLDDNHPSENWGQYLNKFKQK